MEGPGWVGTGRRRELGVPRKVCHMVSPSPAEAVPPGWRWWGSTGKALQKVQVFLSAGNAPCALPLAVCSAWPRAQAPCQALLVSQMEISSARRENQNVSPPKSTPVAPVSIHTHGSQISTLNVHVRLFSSTPLCLWFSASF